MKRSESETTSENDEAEEEKYDQAPEDEQEEMEAGEDAVEEMRGWKVAGMKNRMRVEEKAGMERSNRMREELGEKAGKLISKRSRNRSLIVITGGEGDEEEEMEYKVVKGMSEWNRRYKKEMGERAKNIIIAEREWQRGFQREWSDRTEADRESVRMVDRKELKEGRKKGKKWMKDYFEGALVMIADAEEWDVRGDDGEILKEIVNGDEGTIRLMIMVNDMDSFGNISTMRWWIELMQKNDGRESVSWSWIEGEKEEGLEEVLRGRVWRIERGEEEEEEEEGRRWEEPEKYRKVGEWTVAMIPLEERQERQEKEASGKKMEEKKRKRRGGGREEEEEEETGTMVYGGEESSGWSNYEEDGGGKRRRDERGGEVRESRNKGGLRNIVRIKEAGVGEEEEPIFEYEQGKEGWFEAEGGEWRGGSGKLKEVINAIKEREAERRGGRMVVITRYMEGGIIPLSMIMEEMGYERVGGGRRRQMLVKRKGGEGDRRRYIMMTKSEEISPNNEEDWERMERSGGGEIVLMTEEVAKEMKI